MARHTFVTGINRSRAEAWGYGVVTEVKPRTETIDVPSKSDIRKLIAEETGQVTHDIGLQNRKLAKAVEQAKVAAKDAAEAKEAIELFVETARETFRDIIEELLEPHYRLLAHHLGIELPVEMTRPTTKQRPVLTKKSSAIASSVVSAILAKSKKKTVRRAKSVETEEESPSSPKRKTTSASKKPVAKKKPEVAVTHPRKKGAKPCPKK